MRPITLALMLLSLPAPARANQAAKTGLSSQKLLEVYKHSFSGSSPRISGLKSSRYTIKTAISDVTPHIETLKLIDEAGGNAEAAKQALIKEEQGKAQTAFDQKFAPKPGAKPKKGFAKFFDSSGPTDYDRQDLKSEMYNIERRISERFEGATRKANVKSEHQLALTISAKPAADKTTYATLLHDLVAADRRLSKTKTPEERMAHIEGLLHDKINEQIKANRVGFLKRLATASVEELVGDITRLSHSIIKESGGSKLVKEVVAEASGKSSSTSDSESVMHGQQNGLFGRVKKEIDSHGISSSESSSSFQMKQYEILQNAQSFHIRVSSDAGSSSFAEGAKLPVEARLILEKALKVSEIVAAIATRHPDAAPGLQAWAQNTKITVVVNGKTIEFPLLGVHDAMQRQMVQHGIVDKARVSMLSSATTSALLDDL